MPTAPRIARDIALLIARFGLAVVMIAHGWQKVNETTPSGVAAGFDKLGIPLPTVSAWFAISVELGGGIALILGLLVPVVGVLFAVNMAGAYWFVHSGNGVFSSEGGFELVLVLGILSLVLAVFGSGRFGLDELLFGRKKEPSVATGAPVQTADA